MGISSTTNRVPYLGDGSSATFSYPYEFTAPADLKVYIYNSSLQSATLQVLNTNYTIGGTANAQGIYTQGGSVIFTSSIPTGLYIVIARDPSQVQSYALLQNGNINSTALVQQFDYVTLLIQRLQDEASRACRFADGYAGTLDITVPSGSKAGMYMQVDSSGLHLEWTSSTLYYGSPGLPLIGNGSTAPATFQALSLVGSTVIGVLAPQNGGTGFGGTWTQYAVVYASSATSLTQVPNAGAGLVLTTNASSAPTWQAPQVAQSGILPVVNGGTGIGSIPTGVLIVMSSATQVTGFVAGGTDQVLIGATGVLPIWGQVNIASNSSVIGVLAIANGGTGQSSKAPAFNALSPANVMGDLSWFNGSSNVRLGIGTNNQVATVSGSSVTWANTQTATPNYTAQTTGYSASVGDVVDCSAASFLITLPTAVGNLGKQISVRHSGSSIVQSYTFLCVGGQTVNGVTNSSAWSVVTNGEFVTIMSDGANWKVVSHQTDTAWTAYTPTITGFGSTSSVAYQWRRSGPDIQVRGSHVNATVQTSLASWSVPTTIGTMPSSNTTGNPGPVVGSYGANGGTAWSGHVLTATATSTGVVYAGGNGGTTTMITPSNGSVVTGNGVALTVQFSYPGLVLQP